MLRLPLWTWTNGPAPVVPLGTGVTYIKSHVQATQGLAQIAGLLGWALGLLRRVH